MTRLILAAVALAACTTPEPARRFELLSPSRTGIAFENRLPEDTAFNILNYLNYYNGGGVAIGDVDGNGLPDVFLTSNLGIDRLYLNRGDFRFEDVTATAGVGGNTDGWTTGATMADVNGDGRLDLYVSEVSYLSRRGRNRLLINGGGARFSDRTREYGLEHVGYSTQAAFFDADGDGDLDMYLLNHSVHSERGPSTSPQRERHPRVGDRLFRNDGARFIDVSEASGIHGGVEGYGLGVVASDLTGDGCVDVYVANDFQENDFFYVNDCHGRFTESIERATGHTSRFSMGVDAADYDNDGRADVIVADMLPDREQILKTSATAETFVVHDLKLRAGYHAQYSRNTLQWNRGGGRFSEIGQLAGVAATDWSWAPLFADLDNDGWKDLLVTNGIYRRPNDLDYIALVGTDAVQRALATGVGAANVGLLSQMPQVPIANRVFRNRGDRTFEEVGAAWGLGIEDFSNGAAYADLDNDGALDLVINRINAPAAVYRNRSRSVEGHHYVRVVLRGARTNRWGIGSRVTLWTPAGMQMLEQMPTRGFQSAVDPRLHFGVGTITRVDSLDVVWPGGRSQRLRAIPVDTTLVLEHTDATDPVEPPRSATEPLLVDVTERVGVTVRHRENDFVDYAREPLMTHRLSTEGPALAVADVDGDGLDDIYVGGAKWGARHLLVQRKDGTFRNRGLMFAQDSIYEDVDAAFFDADGDGDQDLYVVSGGNEFWGKAEPLRDRLYLNDGRGHFRRALDALPDRFENGSCVAPADVDGDGDIDLFVGARVVSRAYGTTPRSAVLRNDGRGRFTDVTQALAPELVAAGMVSDAAWVDLDRDGQLDLVVVGEWMPVRVFRQERGRLIDRTAAVGFAATEGWWNLVTDADVDGDGDRDLVLGNLGLNSFIRASAKEPARLFVKDFFGNGTLEQILTVYRQGVSYPVAGRDELVRAMPQLHERYPTHASFGASRLESILPAAERAGALVREARTFASALAINDGGRFTMRVLPTEAQLAPTFAALAEDVDGDGRTDLLLGGNLRGVTPLRGRYDASYGVILRGLPGERFAPVDLDHSQIAIKGDVREIRMLRHASGDRLIAVARNDDRLLIFRASRASRP